MTILFTENDFWIRNLQFREQYAKIIRQAYADAKTLLAQIPDQVTFVNQVAPWECIKEYGSGAYTKNSRLVIIAIDDRLPYGEAKLLEYVRHAVFHELNHVARFEKSIYHNVFLEQCVMEGLATAFERDYADAEPLYGDYNQPEVRNWLSEIITLHGEVDHYQYMFDHDDGRRWIGYKVGTYLVDEAEKASGKSILELTTLAPQTILELAGVTNGPQKP